MKGNKKMISSMYNLKTDLKTISKVITMPVQDFKKLKNIAKLHDISANKLIYLILKAYLKQYD